MEWKWQEELPLPPEKNHYVSRCQASNLIEYSSKNEPTIELHPRIGQTMDTTPYSDL